MLLEKVSAKGCPEDTKVQRARERAHSSVKLRLMDLRSYFFNRFRTTFETRRASHFSKTSARMGPTENRNRFASH